MNSKRSRVKPVFGWLRDQGEPDWPVHLLHLCDGLHLPGLTNGKAPGKKPLRARKTEQPALPPLDPGAVVSVDLDQERKVKASPARLAWMIRNAHRLVPANPKKARAYSKRVLANPAREAALLLLDAGQRKGLPKKLILEGATDADCLIECERLFIWIEGQHNDWLATASKWDICRDRLARNLEAVWRLGQETGKESCLILCYENTLKLHEQMLIEGYRTGKWWAGWPHLGPDVRRELGRRIGTVSWLRIVSHWPALRELPELTDVDAENMTARR